MKRRDHLKGLALFPLAGVPLAQGNILPAPPVHPLPKDKAAAEQNIFRSIGVEPIINCR